LLDDVIATCLAPDRFFMVCNAGPRAAVLAWLQAHAKSGVRLTDRTDDFLCLALQGPRAPELLQRFTSVDLSKVKPFSGAILDFVPPAPWGAAPRAVPPETEGWGARTPMDPSTPPRSELRLAREMESPVPRARGARAAAGARRLSEARRDSRGRARDPASRSSRPVPREGGRGGDEWDDVPLPPSRNRARVPRQVGLA